jgi:hypothetical protein
MEKSVPNQFINQLNNLLLFGKFQIFIMKRLLLLLVLAFYCAGINAQETRSSQESPVMEVNAYLAYLRSSEAGSRNLNASSNRLTDLLKDVQPAVYYLRGEVKAYGENPTSLYTNVSSLSEIDSAITTKESIEILTISVNQMSDLNGRLDLSVLSNFPNLKYVYILSTIETTATVISGLVQNSNARFGVFYKIDKGS